MENVIVPPDVYVPMRHPHTTVFLAGAIDMGAAIDWQAYVIEALSTRNDIVLFNPRRAVPFTPEMLDEQIAWELDHLEAAEIVFMWLPRDSKAPVSMFEAGLFLRSGKLMLGAEPLFYRRRNLEMAAEFYGEKVYDNLDEMIALVMRAPVPAEPPPPLPSKRATMAPPTIREDLSFDEDEL